MAKTISTWIETEVIPLIEKGKKFQLEYGFYRNPFRPIFKDSNYLFSPADGIITNQKIIKAGDSLVNIKGRNYTIRDIMFNPHFDKKEEKLYAVVDIFLTYYNVHYTRFPGDGQIKETLSLPPIKTNNIPMVPLEKEILLNGIVDFSKTDFLFNNERTIVKIWNPKLDSEYWVVNIADFEVDQIVAYKEEGDIIAQNEPMGQIKFGSQVTLIVPFTNNFEWEIIQNDYSVVEGGLDPLLKINWLD